MSKGLGTMQRAIIEAINKGCGVPFFSRSPFPKGGIDSRALRWQMARACGIGRGSTVAHISFNVSFGRAFKGLVKRGILKEIGQHDGHTIYQRGKAFKEHSKADT